MRISNHSSSYSQFLTVARPRILEWGSRAVGFGEGFLCPIRMFLDQNDAYCCILCTVLYRAMHMQRIDIARYMLARVWCLSVCHKIITYHHAINRKPRWTLRYHIAGPMTSAYSDVQYREYPHFFSFFSRRVFVQIP